jgi:wobble nucleotide-excising tRNase
LVYQAQYQSEFFKNPRSTMRQAILKNGEKHFDENTNMVEIIDGNKNSSNRTSDILRKLKA